MNDGSAYIELRRRSGPSIWAVIDSADLPLVEMYRWRAHRLPHTTYARGRVIHNGRTVDTGLHCFLMGMPDGMDVDHKDHDGLNNRRSNLRVATRSQNIAYMLPDRGASSTYKGVCWDKGRRKWKAQIGGTGKSRQIGRYDSEIEAALAYDAAARDVFGEFAWLNFPDGAVPPPTAPSLRATPSQLRPS